MIPYECHFIGQSLDILEPARGSTLFFFLIQKLAIKDFRIEGIAGLEKFHLGTELKFAWFGGIGFRGIGVR